MLWSQVKTLLWSWFTRRHIHPTALKKGDPSSNEGVWIHIHTAVSGATEKPSSFVVDGQWQLFTCVDCLCFEQDRILWRQPYSRNISMSITYVACSRRFQHCFRHDFKSLYVNLHVDMSAKMSRTLFGAKGMLKAGYSKIYLHKEKWSYCNKSINLKQ